MINNLGVEIDHVHQDGEFQSSAFLTFETLSSTSKGRMSPITTTILVSKSTLYEVTPSIFEICFSIFLAQPLQCMDTLSITILGFNWKAKVWFPETTSFNLSNWLLSLAINGLLSNSSWVSAEFMQKQELEQEVIQKQSNTLPKLSFPIINYKFSLTSSDKSEAT